MKSKNICKFVTSDINNQLVPVQFILESNLDAMRKCDIIPVNRIVLIAQGVGKYNINNRYYTCCAGDIIIFFENESYFFEGKTDFRYIYIDFKGLRSNELLRRFNINQSNRIFSGFEGLIPLWMETLSRTDENNIDIAAESMILYTFSRILTPTSKTNNCINEIIEITEKEFSDPQLSITIVAQRLGYNAKYLSHIFKKANGIGYVEYLQTVRIKYAISLFEHGIDSIKNVALLSGFTDPLYFSTVFKNKIGISPKKYIERIFQKQE